MDKYPRSQIKLDKNTNYFCNKVSKVQNKLIYRLFETLKRERISVPIFSIETGIPKDRVYKWKQQDTNPKSEDEKAILAWLDKMDIVPHETNEDPAPYYKKRQEIKSGSKKAIPFYDAPAAAGVTETEMTAISSPAGTIDIGDLLSDSQAAIRIYGNSMLPNYPPGCVVGLAKVSDTFIEPGEVYVIETRDRRILKRLIK